MEKTRITEPSYRELICWCKLNIKQLLVIGYGDTDEHIEKHFGGEIGLLKVIDGYVQTLERIRKIEIQDKHMQQRLEGE